MLRKIEKIVAKLLNNNERLKQLIKWLYTLPFIAIGRFIYRTNFNGKIIEYGQKEKESFFGYYDLKPDNNNGMVLCHQSNHSTSIDPNPEKKIEIALFHLSEPNNPIYLTTTSAYNWQQGSRLQWISDEKFIFNDFDVNKNIYISRIIDINDYDNETIIDKPIQSLINENEFLSLNYTRLAALRPDYGYFNIDTESFNLDEQKNDGIWKVNIQNKKESILYSLSEIIQLGYQSDFLKCKHKINHLMLSPDKKNFLILHRIFSGKKRTGRLILAATDGTSLELLPSNKMVSHYTWIDNDTVLAYLSMQGDEDAYYQINTKNKKYKKVTHLNKITSGDGHPTLLEDGSVVTDTYPDRFGFQQLFLYEPEYDNVILLGSLRHFRSYQLVNRCDLHPKPSSTKNRFYFDSVFSGKRRLYKFDIEKNAFK